MCCSMLIMCGSHLCMLFITHYVLLMFIHCSLLIMWCSWLLCIAHCLHLFAWCSLLGMCCSCLFAAHGSSCIAHVLYIINPHDVLLMFPISLLMFVCCSLFIMCAICGSLLPNNYLCVVYVYTLLTAHHVLLIFATYCSLLIMCCSCLLLIMGGAYWWLFSAHYVLSITAAWHVACCSLRMCSSCTVCSSMLYIAVCSLSTAYVYFMLLIAHYLSFTFVKWCSLLLHVGFMCSLYVVHRL